MAIQTLSTIKDWFRTGLKPTQKQFWDTWDSFRHKYEKVPVGDVEGIDELLNSKTDQSDFKTINGESIIGTGDIISEGIPQNLQDILEKGNIAKGKALILNGFDETTNVSLHPNSLSFNYQGNFTHLIPQESYLRSDYQNSDGGVNHLYLKRNTPGINFFNLPENQNGTSRIIPISVNGQIADINGNILVPSGDSQDLQGILKNGATATQISETSIQTRVFELTSTGLGAPNSIAINKESARIDIVSEAQGVTIASTGGDVSIGDNKSGQVVIDSKSAVFLKSNNSIQIASQGNIISSSKTETIINAIGNINIVSQSGMVLSASNLNVYSN